MIITPDQKAKLEGRTLPADQVRSLTAEYMAKAQITQSDLARRIGFGPNTLSLFMQNKYSHVSESDVRLRVALTDYMAAYPLEVATKAPGRLYETESVRIMRRLFNQCLNDRSMACCYGAPGSQKTFGFSHLVAEHNRRETSKNGHGTRAYHVYCSEKMSPRELLRKMCRAALVRPGCTIQDSIQNLSWELRNRKSIFILDEAQHLPLSTLEVVREINEQPPYCAIVLAGSHRLAALFRQRAAELEQWNSRLVDGVSLPGMTDAEAISVIAEELGRQTPESVKGLVDRSRVGDIHGGTGTVSKGSKVPTYISARRLFRQLAGIQARLSESSAGGVQ